MNISNVAYHGEIQKKAAMERQRELTEIIDNRGKNRARYSFMTRVLYILSIKNILTNLHIDFTTCCSFNE